MSECKGFIGDLPPGADGIKTAYFETDYNANIGDIRTRSILTVGNHRFPFTVPPDFSVFVEAYIERIPAASFAGKPITLESDYALIGESFQTNSELDNTTLYSGTVNQWGKLDLSTVLSNLQAGHIGGVTVTHVVVGTTVYYGRLVLRYM